MDDAELARLLSHVEPRGRNVLRRAMRADQVERDNLAARLLREHANELADLVDLASLHPSVRRQIARALGELETIT